MGIFKTSSVWKLHKGTRRKCFALRRIQGRYLRKRFGEATETWLKVKEIL